MGGASMMYTCMTFIHAQGHSPEEDSICITLTVALERFLDFSSVTLGDLVLRSTVWL